MARDASARSARARCRSGLLTWLRPADDAAGLREKIAVLRQLAASAGHSGNGVLWRSAEALLASLLDGSLKSDENARQMCRRIERQLAADARRAAGADEELGAALFAFVSGRSKEDRAADRIEAAGDDHSHRLPVLRKTIENSLAMTAEILPLVAGWQPPRHGEACVAGWRAAVKALDEAWCAGRGHAADCRQPATELVAAALVIDAPACLQLAEALASACARGEDAEARQHPALRAAIAAALEIAGERDAPNHAYFDQRAALAVARLAAAEDRLRQALRPDRIACTTPPTETRAAPTWKTCRP